MANDKGTSVQDTDADEQRIGVIGAGEGAMDAVSSARERGRGGKRFRRRGAADKDAAGTQGAEQGAQPKEASGGKPQRAGGGKSAKGNAITNGFAAMRDVRAAAKEHTDARAHLRDLEAALAVDEQELARRDDVMANYERIVGEEQAEQREAQRIISEQGERRTALERERRSLEDRLAQEKADNEQALRPYKELTDTSRGRSEDASRALAEAKRAVKSAESQLSEATTLREQNIASANRALDNSQARLRRVDEELRKLNDDPSASPEAAQRLQRERTSELAHVNSAREEVQTVTQSSQANVDRAQEKLFTLRNSLEGANAEASRAKADYEARRKEYEDLLNQAHGREQDIQNDIDQHEHDIDDARSAVDDARSRLAESREIEADANDIHGNPGATEDLRASVREQKKVVKEQRTLVDGLATTEKRLRKTTRGVRVAFVLLVVVLVAVLVVVLLLALGLGAA